MWSPEVKEVPSFTTLYLIYMFECRSPAGGAVEAGHKTFRRSSLEEEGRHQVDLERSQLGSTCCSLFESCVWERM